MTGPRAHRCGRCKAWACYGFAAPHDNPDPWQVWACAAHRDAAEAAWRSRFG